MRIHFVDKNARSVYISVNGEIEGELVLKFLASIPDSEFIMRPVIVHR